MKSKYWGLALLPLLVACHTKNEGSLFIKRPAQETGIAFSNTLTESDDLNILDYLYFYNGGGVAIGDINNDGLPDLYFSANQEPNKLYLNKGNLTFEDITETAGVAGQSTWNTGTVMVDINADGLLDIYVCAVVGLNGFNGHNELFINQGDGTFTEEAAAYGLDFESYSSNAAFLDYDRDGDLDMYLLNHAVHTQGSYGKASLRNERTYETGDKLLRNDNGMFVDVSAEAGIYGGINGYGLGLAVSDFNQDGYPDLYVGNDFHEDDYYYLNNGDGTFTESLRDHFGHTSRFSMGSDVADINHDGFPDLISLDMLPEDEKVLKSSEGDDNIQIQKLRIQDYGYHYQFTRNMLYLNQPDGHFMETALQSGVAATDWSWSALFADFDQDGEQDLFVSNGIPKRPNDLDYINYLSNENIQNKINNTNLMDQKALELMPTGKVGNKIFQGGKDLVFKDRSNTWIPQDTLASGATAYADLDNDGDLDIVTNNSNAPASLYENKTNGAQNYLRLFFEMEGANTHGIGTKVFAYANGQLQYKELYPARGFQASSEPMVHFGYGAQAQVDSIKVIWPNQEYQILRNIPVNQTLTIVPKATGTFSPKMLERPSTEQFIKLDGQWGLDFVHQEDNYSDFNRQKLMPYQIADRGPATSVADLNGDGKEDVYFGGSKYLPPKVYLQTDSTFVESTIAAVARDSIKEDVVSTTADFDGDGTLDLIVGSGGADFFNQMKPLTDSYYGLKDSTWVAREFPELYDNASVLLPFDYDGDGDLDLFVGSQSVSADFGKFPDSYLMENHKGQFTVVEDNPFKALGMVTDAVAHDHDGDGDLDLIIIGEWMAPVLFLNHEGTLGRDPDFADEDLNGLWQAITPFDVDGDGDMDYLLGNWGLNTKFRASEEHPMQMHYGDFDQNGSSETVVSIHKDTGYYPLEGLNELSTQLISLRKKFTSYASFAGKTMNEIFGAAMLDRTEVRTVATLASGYLENNKGRFTFVPFGFELQTAPIMAFLTYDFDRDGQTEVLAGGNYFGVKPYHGRFDSFPGALIHDKDHVVLGNALGLDFTSRSIRHINMITVKNDPYLLVTMNNGPAQVYRLAATKTDEL